MLLPPSFRPARAYYRSHVANQTRGHADEDDPARIRMLQERARADAQWVMQKVRPGQDIPREGWGDPWV